MLTQANRAPAPRPWLTIAHADAEAPPSLLGPLTGIAGTLEIDGELVISGWVKGHIAASRVTITRSGYVEGDIVAHKVAIAGRLSGRVFAPIVTVETSAEVEGRLFHTDITVARGARVTGRMPWRPLSYFQTLTQLPEIRP